MENRSFIYIYNLLKVVINFLALFFITVGAVSPVLAIPFAPPPDVGIEYPAASGLRNNDVRLSAATIIRTALGLLGIISVVTASYAGFKWMTSGGNEDQITEAKKMLYASVVGLAIILLSYAITTFVIKSLVTAL